MFNLFVGFEDNLLHLVAVEDIITLHRLAHGHDFIGHEAGDQVSMSTSKHDDSGERTPASVVSFRAPLELWGTDLHRRISQSSKSPRPTRTLHWTAAHLDLQIFSVCLVAGPRYLSVVNTTARDIAPRPQ